MDEHFMQAALAEAEMAASTGEVPIGAVLVRGESIIARAHNMRERDKDPLAHAEIKVLRSGSNIIGDWRLSECTLYVTLEPCLMCLGALFQARIDRLVFGAYDDKRLQAAPDLLLPSLKNRMPATTGVASCILHLNNHSLKVTGGILVQNSVQILKEYFAMRRMEST